MELGFSGERKKHHLEFTSAKPDYLHNLQFQAGYDFLQHFYWAFNRLENTNRENSETIWGRILGAQRNLIIHLVIVALRAVAVETESLVGQKLLGASVNGGTDGNTAGKRLAGRYYQIFQIRPKGFMGENSVLMHGGMERVGRSR